MNKNRRKEIQSIIAQLAEVEALLSNIRGSVESIHDDERDYVDSMPESLGAEDAVRALDDAVSMLDDIDLDDVISSLEEAL